MTHEDLKRAALADADEISARIHAGGYRANLSDTERLRNHVRRLAAEIEALGAERDDLKAALANTDAVGQRVLDEKQSAERRALEAEQERDRLREALEQIADSSDAQISAVRLFEGAQEIARAALQPQGGGDA